MSGPGSTLDSDLIPLLFDFLDLFRTKRCWPPLQASLETNGTLLVLYPCPRSTNLKGPIAGSTGPRGPCSPFLVRGSCEEIDGHAAP
jgi:hypothetical protein